MHSTDLRDDHDRPRSFAEMSIIYAESPVAVLVFNSAD